MTQELIRRAMALVGRVPDPAAIARDMMDARAKGGGVKRSPRLLQDQYPTSYMPNVGRQVMAEGGVPDPMEQPQPDLQQPEQLQQPEPQFGGLQFPQEEGLFRLRAKLKREDAASSGKKVSGAPVNPRTVIPAPKDSGLPDFVAGDLTFKDWMNRHENILNDDEIHAASKWYKNVASSFDRYYPNDPDLARKNMRAWLVAQQNISPAGAMNNVLMQKEQIARSVPKDLWRAGGMPNPTEAARSVLQDQPIAGGVGQKIADFVDSAEQKDVRSWMANHPDGESPFVVDVHTARDTGMVDPELINHLTKIGYDKKKLAKLQIDLKGTPTEAAYENRASFGRKLTQHLNQISWKGRNDWRSEEVQAVGWMGMTKLTRNAEEDSESGLSRNMRRLSFEVDPGEGSPWASKFGDAFGEMSHDEKAEVTRRVADVAMKHASDLAGIDVHSLVHGVGAWENYQNPSAVAQSLSTQSGADIASNALGYLLNQTEVWHNRVKPITANPKGFGIDFIEKGSKNLADREYLSGFWKKIMDADETGLFRGFQPITLPTGEVGVRALIDKGGVLTKQKIEQSIAKDGPIHNILSDLGINVDVLGHEAEITKHGNDWKENPDGKSYMERLVNLVGPDRAAGIDRIRGQLESDLEKHIEEIRSQRSEAPRQERAKGGEVSSSRHPALNIPGIHIVTADAGEPIFDYEEGSHG
jgi:hypothetical protein